jgi:hypothetical protein
VDESQTLRLEALLLDELGSASVTAFPQEENPRLVPALDRSSFPG